MDLFEEFKLAIKEPFSLKSFYVLFVNIFIFLTVGVILASILSTAYA
jgi:hypothetical protein